MSDIVDIDFDNIQDGPQQLPANVASPATPRAAVLQLQSGVSPGSPGSVLSGKTSASGLSGRVRDSAGTFRALCDTGEEFSNPMEKNPCCCCGLTPRSPSPLCTGPEREWLYPNYKGKWCRHCGAMARIVYSSAGGKTLNCVESWMLESPENHQDAITKSVAYILCKLDPSRERVTLASINGKVVLIEHMLGFFRMPALHGMPSLCYMGKLHLLSDLAHSPVNPLLTPGNLVGTIRALDLKLSASSVSCFVSVHVSSAICVRRHTECWVCLMLSRASVLGSKVSTCKASSVSLLLLLSSQLHD